MTLILSLSLTTAVKLSFAQFEPPSPGRLNWRAIPRCFLLRAFTHPWWESNLFAFSSLPHLGRNLPLPPPLPPSHLLPSESRSQLSPLLLLVLGGAKESLSAYFRVMNFSPHNAGRSLSGFLSCSARLTSTGRMLLLLLPPTPQLQYRYFPAPKASD